MPYLMGIDVGTTATRAVLVRPDGHVAASASAEHEPVSMPKAGWAEQKPEDWWHAAIEAVRFALHQASLPGSEIAAVGLSGQMHGVTLLDKSNAVLRPAMLWCDQRTQAQCDWITSRVGPRRLIQWVSNPALTGFSAPKLLWIREHEPRLYERAAHFLLPKDYVRLRLAGEYATDVSDASGTLLFDVVKRCWSREILESLEIDRALLPEAYESTQAAGQVSSEAALVTGLRAGTPIVAGAGDQAASAIGNGIVAPGLASATIGTSGVIFSYTDVPARDPGGRVHTFCHAVPGKWQVMGVTQGAGLSLRWFREQLGESESWYARQVAKDPYDVIIEEAKKAPPGCEGLLFLPYLMGERTPHLDPQARGMWFGLTAAHTRAHLIRSILEGVAFSLRDAIEILTELKIPISQIRASGGGSRSPLWLEIQASIYRQEVVTLAESEGSAFGAALLAGAGCGIFASVQEAVREIVRVRQTASPHPKAVQVYDELYQIYRRLYPAVRELAHQLDSLGRDASETG